MNADKPKSFTVAVIRNAVIRVNKSTFLSSAPPNEERAELCILCKFLVQGIRAHEIFRDIPTFDPSGVDKIKELYDGLKYSVFNDEDGVFTEKSIKHGDTSYDIPINFLTKTAQQGITDDMKISIKNLVTGLALLFSNKYSNPGVNKGDTEITFKTRPMAGSSLFSRDIKTFSFISNTLSKNKMIQLIQTKMKENTEVNDWYTKWVSMYNVLFPDPDGYGCPIAINGTTSHFKGDTIVGKVLQTGGKLRARTRRAMRAMCAMRGSTKCKQHKQHKQRKTQHKQRKQRKATRRK